MRLYNMYFICKTCRKSIEGLTFTELKRAGTGEITGYRIEGWQEYRKSLEELCKIPCLKTLAESAFNALDVFSRDAYKPIISRTVYDKLVVV